MQQIRAEFSSLGLKSVLLAEKVGLQSEEELTSPELVFGF